MKSIFSKFVFFATLTSSLTSQAYTTRNDCLEQLTELIIPSLTQNIFVVNGLSKKMHIDVDDYDDGIYELRLTIPKKPSPGNPNTDGVAGWVKLDVKKLEVSDESKDRKNPVAVNVNRKNLKSIVHNCSL